MIELVFFGIAKVYQQFYTHKLTYENLYMIMNNSIENSEKLNVVNAHYIKYLKLEYKILQQKTQLHQLKEGDANTKYFHAVITVH